MHGDLAQLGEHFLDVEGVMGSSPLASTIRDKKGDEIGHSSPFLYFIQTVFSGLDPRSERTKEGNGNNRIFCEVSE